VTEPGDAVVALFAELLGIPTGTQEAITAMSPVQKKGLLFRTFLAQLEGLAARGAVRRSALDRNVGVAECSIGIRTDLMGLMPTIRRNTRMTP
jgi:hypothetical protein